MKLRSYLKQTMLDIIGSVQDVHAELKEQYDDPNIQGVGVVNPVFLAHGESTRTRLTNINFDIATTVSESGSGSATASIEVVGFKLGEAGGELSTQSSAVSRINFSIDVILPTYNITGT